MGENGFVRKIAKVLAMAADHPIHKSTHHLGPSSGRPPLVEDRLRLYSMEYCPYAQRPRLVLLVKKLAHDVVNINLGRKPDWYFNIHPEGKVPALDTGSQIVIESLDICDFLDEKYPNPPLYPTNPAGKKADKEFIQKLGPILGEFVKIIYNQGETDVEKITKDVAPHAQILEEELAKRKSVFFGGHSPGMIDYVLWPWAERTALLKLRLGKDVIFENENLPLLTRWTKQMRKQPAVVTLLHEPETYAKLLDARAKNPTEIDYDNI